MRQAKLTVITVITGLISLPRGVWADGFTNADQGFGHMSLGGGTGMVGGLMMLIFWGFVVAAIVGLTKWWSGGGRGGPLELSAEDALKLRLAKGEISEADFKRLKSLLDT